MSPESSNLDQPGAVPASVEQTIAERVDQELKRCLDQAAEGLHWVGPDGTILWANQTELDLLGYTREEYIGHNIAEFHVDQSVIQDILTRLTRGETLLNYEAQLRRKDGSTRHVSINSNVLWRDDQFLHTRCFTRDVTDRRVANELARRLADIVENSEDAIIAHDLSGIIQSWNPAAERLYGYTSAEACGQSIRIIIPAEREQEEAELVRRVRDGERIAPFDTVRRRKDGDLVDVALTISPIRDREGRIVGSSKTARNVTDRKRVERQLEDVQQRLMGLATAAASLVGSPNVDAVLSAAIDVARDVFRSDGYALWRVNDKGEWRIVRSFGVSDEFAARMIKVNANQPGAARVPFTEPLVCEDVNTSQMVAQMRDAYQREGIGSMIVFPLVIRGERSGTMVFYSHRPCRYEALDVRLGTALTNLVASSLTTAELYEEQRIAREGADHARERAAFLARAGTALSASLDYETTLKAVAELAVPAIADWCAVDMLGERGSLQRLAVAHVDPAKVKLARRLQQQYSPDPDAPGGVYEVIRTGKPVLVSRIPPALLEAAAQDPEHLRILQELKLTSYMCVPMMAHSRAFGAITFVSAESLREYTEEDLQFAQDVAIRASLAVDNARSYARANDASRVKDEFLATLSHELRTPLNAVLGYARMLRLGTLDEAKQRAALEVVERNATALKQMIEDVLDVSRIVSGRMRLDVEPVDLPSVLQEATAAVLPAAHAKGVRVETTIDPLNSPVSGDAHRMQQIAWNLLSNAIKFTPRGGRVQLRLARVNSHVEITVSDTGRGIDPEFLPFVFERFRQADASFSREHGGLGLGLAIVRQLTELHGGTVSAASGGVGQGATFTVKLPLMIVHPVPRDSGDRPHPHAEGQPPAADDVPRLDGLHVLAVDDEPDSLQLLKTVLEGAGAVVTTAASGPAALEEMKGVSPDVIIADVGMPGMDGLQLIRRVRQLTGAAQRTPAAALTAYARAQDRITSLASGYQMHLVKPIDPIELIVAVSSLAGRRMEA
jgi:PAS domain S-box-containing protein